jgi:hypothetical protein
MLVDSILFAAVVIAVLVLAGVLLWVDFQPR